MGRFATSSRRSIARFHCPLQSCRRPDRQAVAVALCLLIALSPTLAKPLLAAAPPEKVLASDRSAVRFSLSDLEPVWTEHVLRGGKLKLHRLRLTGFVNVGEPARPELPQRGGWVLVPPGKRPRVVAIDERWESITPRRLMVGLRGRRSARELVSRFFAVRTEFFRTVAEGRRSLFAGSGDLFLFHFLRLCPPDLAVDPVYTTRSRIASPPTILEVLRSRRPSRTRPAP